MLGIKRLTRSSFTALKHVETKRDVSVSHEPPFSRHFLPQRTFNRFFDIYQFGNKKAIERERARILDEMNRGYFADMSEFHQHGGKIASANKILIPALAAVKFPSLEICFTDGRVETLPVGPTGKENSADAEKSTTPEASLICLLFRANSQSMIESWSLPFLEKFRGSENLGLYEVSFVDSWLLSRSLIKKLLLRIMKKSEDDGNGSELKRQIVYSFGDHYFFRKELHILNLLSGYVFLVDKFGRVRWQGFGLATQEELSSLLSCTTLLLEENLSAVET